MGFWSCASGGGRSSEVWEFAVFAVGGSELFGTLLVLQSLLRVVTLYVWIHVSEFNSPS